MKKIFLRIEFAFILLALVIYPIVMQIFQPQDNTTVRLVYPAQIFFMGLLAAAVFIQVKEQFSLHIQGKKTILNILVLSGEGLKTFGFLCVISVFFELLGHFLKAESGISEVIFPEKPFLWANFFIGTLCAAFYEEVIYRVYLPESLRMFFPKIRQFFWEAAAIILFALGHMYLGALGFLNALFCACVLRLCVRKTHTIWFSFVAHALYNFGSFFIMAAQ